MSKKIHTVSGEIDSESLGFTQCHEHLMLSKGVSYEINTALCIDDLEKSVQEAVAYCQAGGNTIVEAQPGGCNRDSEGLVSIAQKTGLNIVASTGFHKMQFYTKDHWIRTMNEVQLTQIFVHELTEGMYTCLDQDFNEQQQDAKAGIIKTALDKCNFDEPYNRLFGAAVETQKKTGAPLMVHIEAGSSPVLLLDFLKEKGADLVHTYFCHMDRACEDDTVLKKVLEAGISLEFDTIGRFKYHSDEYEIVLIKKILEWGYEDQLLISLDTTRARLKSYDPEAVGLTYILNTFIPAMIKAGIPESQIKKITRDNPGRILTWSI